MPKRKKIDLNNKKKIKWKPHEVVLFKRLFKIYRIGDIQSVQSYFHNKDKAKMNSFMRKSIGLQNSSQLKGLRVDLNQIRYVNQKLTEIEAKLAKKENKIPRNIWKAGLRVNQSGERITKRQNAFVRNFYKQLFEYKVEKRKDKESEEEEDDDDKKKKFKDNCSTELSDRDQRVDQNEEGIINKNTINAKDFYKTIFKQSNDDDDDDDDEDNKRDDNEIVNLNFLKNGMKEIRKKKYDWNIKRLEMIENELKNRI